MAGSNNKGYGWAVSAGLNAALAAISAKFFSYSMKCGNLDATSSVAPYMVVAEAGTPKVQSFSNRRKEHYIEFGLVIVFNVVMWGCYVNSLKALSSLQATVTNFATNFLSSGLAGFFLFEEALPLQWFAGALLIVIGVFVLSRSSIEEKTRTD